MESYIIENTNVIQQSHFLLYPAIPSHRSIKPKKVAFIIAETSEILTYLLLKLDKNWLIQNSLLKINCKWNK